MKKNYRWEWHFKSEPVHVRGVVSDILQYLDETLPQQTQEERGELRLIFSELLYNAVLHGNASDNQKQVHIGLTVAGPLICACITDEGNGYNYQKTIAQLNEACDLYREKGRGLQLVKALVDGMSFDREGRSVIFEKRIGQVHG